MQRRVIAAVAAVLLAGIGAVLLYTYVNSAETRAMSNMATTEVLVAAKAVPAGTLGANIGPFVELKKLPRIAVVPNALTSTTEVADMVTVSELQVGEQVLASRFAKPDTTTTGEVEVPSDLQLISVPLEVARVVGATIQPGDKVALFFSGDDDGKPATALALRDVLVVRVQGSRLGGEGGEGEEAAAPTGTEIVTLALKAKDSARVVYAAEHNRIWVALEPADGGDELFTVKAGDSLK